MTSFHETFEQFKNSFSYGSRTDMNFKFLKSLSDEAAAQFFQDLLWKLGDTLNDGDLGRLLDHVIAWQQRAYSESGRYVYDETPFTPLAKPLTETRIGLLSSSGHFVEGDDPMPFGVQEMTQEEALARIDDFLKSAPQLSTIPIDTPPSQLHVRHGGYDVRAAQSDPNVVFPINRLRELNREGLIGDLAPDAYSFVGATSQLRLQKEAAPEWVALFQAQQIEAMILIPV